MYINFWYPICLKDELTHDAPKRVELLGLRFVAFRDGDGRAHVLSDTCVHRGGSLSRGKVKEGCVECPYHGWRFNGEGRCVRIPSMPDDKPPARAKVDSYPTEEKYGIVFAFLGDLPADERPPITPVPEYEQEGWRASRIAILDVDCYYERSMENGLDPAHNEFVHPGQGYPPPRYETFESYEKDWGKGFWMNFGDPVLEMTTFARERNVSGKLRAGSWYHGPNGLITSIFINPESNLVQYFFEAPVNDHHTRIYFLNMRNCMLDEAMDDKVMEVNLGITREDIGILEELWPVRTPDSLTKEIMTPSDRIVVIYRESLEDWTQRGWQIDRQAMREKHGDVAFAIPCPERRSSGNWVMDTVPLVQGES